jgi:AcrR family transcriptional regulator
LQHILWAAKDVFLEMGFERASMDVVAARAETSKRSLYAHFESKDKLFLAVVDLVREPYLGRLKTPGDYAQGTAEAVVLFCGRFLQLLLWEPALRTCRLGIAEAERLPEASAQYYDAIFNTTQERPAKHRSLPTSISPRSGGPSPRSCRPRRAARASPRTPLNNPDSVEGFHGPVWPWPGACRRFLVSPPGRVASCAWRENSGACLSGVPDGRVAGQVRAQVPSRRIRPAPRRVRRFSAAQRLCSQALFFAVPV